MTSETITDSEVRIELYDYAWAHVAEFDQFDAGSFKLTRNDVGADVLTFTVPYEVGALACNVTKNATTQTVYQWGPGGTFHVRVYIRNRQEFEGTIVLMDDDEEEAAGTPGQAIIDVQIEAWDSPHAYLARRTVKGASGDRHALTSVKADTAIASLINANCKTGDVVEPAAYAGLGTSGVDRENFGDALVQATADDDHATTIDRVRWDNNEDLYTAVIEMCRRYECRLSGTWNAATSPPTLTIKIDYYGDVATDKTATIKFSRENGGLRCCPRTVELMRESNVAEVGGRGTRQNQYHGYAIHQSSYDSLGLMETGDVWASADEDDAEAEAEFIIAQVGGCATTYKPRIQEADGLQWGEDFTFDKIRIDDSRRGITIEDYITKAEFTMPGPKDVRIEFTLGRDEASPDQRQQRSGGGGSGGKRAGGKPKEKNGEPAAPKTINCDSGVVTFDEPEDEMDYLSDAEDRVRPGNIGGDDGDGDGTTETIFNFVQGTYHMGAPTADGYVYLWDPGLGRCVKLLAEENAGGGGPGEPAIPDP